MNIFQNLGLAREDTPYTRIRAHVPRVVSRCREIRRREVAHGAGARRMECMTNGST